MDHSHSQDNEELVEFRQAEWAEPDHRTQSLPRVDGGKQAWLFLAACFMLEALVWGNVISANTGTEDANDIAGFPFSYGVFQVSTT